MDEKDYYEQLKKAESIHGHVCGGLASGVKLAMYGLELVGLPLNKRHKNLIVFLEIDRCMCDAIQAVTYCTLGKRTLKHVDYGKFAATFYNQDTGEAFRISDLDSDNKFNDDETKEEMIARFSRTPPADLFKFEKVNVELSRGDMPGLPYIIVSCSICGEIISDGRHKLIRGKPVCKSCAEESYYEIIDD